MRRSSPRTTFTNVVPKVSPANVPLLVRRRVTTPTAPVETKVQFVMEKRSTSVMLSAGCPPTEWPAQSSVTSCVSWTSRHVPDEDRSAVVERVPGGPVPPQPRPRGRGGPASRYRGGGGGGEGGGGGKEGGLGGGPHL